jgi:RNA polymerase sigma-70 factor (ECF subfamily)
VSKDDLYRQAAAAYGPALQRLARAYEADPDKRRDLLQDIHVAVWRSFEVYEERCSIRTWVFRVAHNVAASYVTRQRSISASLVSLRQIEEAPGTLDHERDTEQQMAVDRLMRLVHRLKPFDRQLMLLYLEGMEGAAIGEITGMSAGNVRIQIHRIKNILTRRFHGGGPA